MILKWLCKVWLHTWRFANADWHDGASITPTRGIYNTDRRPTQMRSQRRRRVHFFLRGQLPARTWEISKSPLHRNPVNVHVARCDVNVNCFYCYPLRIVHTQITLSRFFLFRQSRFVELSAKMFALRFVR